MTKRILTLFLVVIMTAFTAQIAFATDANQQIEAVTAVSQATDKKADISVSAQKVTIAVGEKTTVTIKYSNADPDKNNDIIKVISFNKTVASFKVVKSVRGLAVIEITGNKAGSTSISFKFYNKSTGAEYDSAAVNVTVTNDKKPTISAIENVELTTVKNSDVKVRINDAAAGYAIVVRSSNKYVADVEVGKIIDDESNVTIIPKRGGVSEITVTLYEDNTYTSVLDTQTFTVKVDDGKFSVVEFIMNIINFILNLFK